MEEVEGGWERALVAVFFATIAALYGWFGGYALLGMISVFVASLRPLQWPMDGFLFAAALLHLTTSAVCGYAAVRRLDDRPVLTIGLAGITLAILTPVLSLLWSRTYYFPGM